MMYGKMKGERKNVILLGIISYPTNSLNPNHMDSHSKESRLHTNETSKIRNPNTPIIKAYVLELIFSYPNCITRFTDRSKNPDHVGYAHTIDDNCSVEVLAIFHCL